MRRTRSSLAVALAALSLAALAGCGGGGGSALPTASKYDAGPRAGEAAADPQLAARGEALFAGKGCATCHAHGRRLTGPDLAGVSMRRTREWLERQILDPATMVREDPIARELRTLYALEMPRQALAADEVAAVIEFLKRHDQAAGLVPAPVVARPAREAGPPSIRKGSSCARCGMRIEDLRFATARRVGPEWRRYDSIECLLADRERVADVAAWLADYESGRLLPEDRAWVLRGDFPSPMGGGLAAFADRAAAESLAIVVKGRVTRLADVAPPAPTP